MVMPSRFETFGLAALEGMSFGKPVVHFDLPALRWMDGDVRVPPFDVFGLAGGMRDLLAIMRRDVSWAGRRIRSRSDTGLMRRQIAFSFEIVQEPPRYIEY